MNRRRDVCDFPVRDRSLLMYAAMRDAAAVREYLAQDSLDVWLVELVAALRESWPAYGLHAGTTPLMLAMRGVVPQGLLGNTWKFFGMITRDASALRVCSRRVRLICTFA